MNSLVLSLFPGIGLLDMAFEEEGFCVVRGPDLLWGGDIRRFHPPAGKFDGVIGGPPCQTFSSLQSLQRAHGYAPRHGNLIPEFERVVAEAAPYWFLMENVPDAPLPEVVGYPTADRVIRDVWVGGATRRRRRFTLGVNPKEPSGLGMPAELSGWYVDELALCPWDARGAVTSSDGGAGVAMERYTLAEAIELQGLPPDFFAADSPLTVDGKRKMIGNGVPLPMGRAIARAVKRALSPSEDGKAA